MTSIDDIAVERVPIPVPGAGEVLVRSTVVGICGSDVHAAAGRHPFIDLPYQPGHEVVGRVVETGVDVEGLAAGDRVVIEPGLSCGRCRQCGSGRRNICQHLKVFGCQTPGGMADYLSIAADRLHLLPAGMSDLAAALVEPLATPVHAVRRAADVTDRRVLVLGAGPIGLLSCVAARAAGAASVAATDLAADKREHALRLGAVAAFDARDGELGSRVRGALGGAPDLVFDCVAREPSMRQAIELVDKGGTVLVVGVPEGPTSVRLDLVQDREIAVLGSLMYTGDDVRAAIELVRSGAVRPDDLITATFDLDDAAGAFRAATDGDQVKVVVTVG